MKVIPGMTDRIDAVVKDKGLPVKTLAQNAKLDRKIFYNYGNMSLDSLYKFCGYTGASADYLLGLSDGMYRRTAFKGKAISEDTLVNKIEELWKSGKISDSKYNTFLDILDQIPYAWGAENGKEA